MKTQLYKYDGTPLFEVIVDDTSSQDWSLMSDNRLSVSFELEECVVLTAGCYIDFDNTRFYLLNEYKPTMICSSAWKYDLTLGDAASWLSITLALKTIDGENTPLFKYTGPAAEHAAIIVANLNRRMGTGQWKVGSVISTENIAIDYSGKYCSEVLQEIVDAKDTEWWIDGMTLNIGRAEFGESVTLGYMNGVLGDIVCDTAGDMRSYAYLFPIGSTRNIDPTKYGHDRLQLPSGLVSVPINPEQGIAELKEEAAFAHIYPRYEGTVSAVRYAKATNADGTPFLIYYIKDTSIPFNPNEYEIAGLFKHITFNSGELMGQEFEVKYSADSNEFELITRWTGDIQLPGGVLVPAVGDKYVVWNISMPDVYYTLASHELLDAARAYAADAVKDVSVYKVKLDYIEIQERGLKLRPGQRVRLMSDEYFASGYYDSRITRITRNIAYPDELSVDISAVRVVGTLSRLQASIQKTENVVAQFSGQLPAIIKSNDDTSADDSSVYTSAKSEKEFLNKRKGGKVSAPVTFDEVAEFLNGLVAHKYIKIGNGYLRYNDELGVWEMVGDLLVTGAVTMFGSLSGFKPSTIMDAVQVDNETIIKVKDAQGNWVLRALGGGGSGGTGGGLTAAEVNVLIEAALVPYALKTAIPTNNNQLTNGAGYITTSALLGYATEQWISNQGFAKQSSLDGVDNRLKSVETFFATSDTDSLVNKWSEIVTFLNATEGDTLDNILKTKANQSALDDAVASLTTEIGKKWTQNDAKIANWDSAFGWGNHANAGYAAKTYVNGELAKYVKLATAQNISARHNFTDGLQIGGITIRKSQDGVVYIEGNLAIKGALTMFGTDATIPSSIWENIPFNLEQMSWDGSQWNIIGDGGGSVDTAAVNVLISEYLAKNSYATQSWVQNQGYLTTHQSLAHLLSKTDAANTYQPIINSTNKLAYSLISGTPDLSVYFRSSDFTKANIKSTLGISDWALAATKPSYTAAEVGAYIGSGNVIPNGKDLANLQAGSYWVYENLGAASAAKLSYSSLVVLGNSYYSPQMNISHNAQQAYIRGVYNIGSGNSVSDWHELAFVDSNVASATKLQTPRTIWGRSFDGTGNVVGALSSVSYLTFIDTESGIYQGNRFSGAMTKDGVLISGDLISLFGGNVAIGGTTADAKLHVYGDAKVTSALTVATNVQIPVNGDRITFNSASGTYTKGVLAMNANNTYLEAPLSSDSKTASKPPIMIGWTDGTYPIYINPNTNVSIGGTSASAKLHVHGDILATGAITMFSQLSMKNVIDYEGLSLAQLAHIRPARFTWKDGRDNRIHVGGIADEVMQILPEVIYQTSDDKLTMDYGSAAFYVGASLIKPVIDHEKRIAELERENAELKRKVERLSA